MKENNSMLIPFLPFNPMGEVRVYGHGIMPHWRQDGCAYFVTFRLADSIPKHILEQFEEDRLDWLRSRGIDGNQRNWKSRFAALPVEQQREYEREFGEKHNGILDKGLGSCSLRNPEIAQIVAGTLDFHHGKRLYTGDYMIMPNHVHALMTPIVPIELEEILQTIKGFSAKMINQRLDRNGTFW